MRSLAQVITLVTQWIDAYGIHHWLIFRTSYRKLTLVEFEPTTTEFCLDPLANLAIKPWVQLDLRAYIVQLVQFYPFVQCRRLILVFASASSNIFFKQSLAEVITLVPEWIDTYGIHHWQIFKSSYRKLAWVVFEPTTTELRSDALTDWTIVPWLQLPLRANFVQLLQFHLLVSK